MGAPRTGAQAGRTTLPKTAKTVARYAPAAPAVCATKYQRKNGFSPASKKIRFLSAALGP